MKMGALDGLSIGFKSKSDMVSYDKRSRKRLIKEVDLMGNIIVTFPMNPKATVRSVKASEISIREWESGLRDAFNLSRSEAKVAAGAITKSFDENQQEVESANTELVEAIKNLTLTLKILKEDIMSENVKSIQDLGQTFSEFKKVNDERLEKLEKGESTAES